MKSNSLSKIEDKSKFFIEHPCEIDSVLKFLYIQFTIILHHNKK